MNGYHINRAYACRAAARIVREEQAPVLLIGQALGDDIIHLKHWFKNDEARIIEECFRLREAARLYHGVVLRFGATEPVEQLAIWYDQMADHHESMT